MTKVEVPVIRLPHAAGLPLPAYQSASAAGLDLMAAIPEGAPLVIAPGDVAAIPTGIVLGLPEGYEGQVRPRSGLAVRHGVTVLNAPGTIDSDYRGEVSVLLINHGRNPFEVVRGMRIAQLIVAIVACATIKEVENLNKTKRGSGGFGSTGSVPGATGRNQR
ncbi:MAG: dUTP diphosphatase [Pseudorhodoplanes sp.]